MKAHQLAQVLLRVVAIFLVWRTLEFGISQFIGFQYQTRVLVPSSDEAIAKAYSLIQTLIIISTIISVGVAALLWWLSPALARLIIPGATEDSASDHLTVPAATLLRVAGFVFIALAFANLPQIIYSFSADRLRDPDITLMTSRVLPDALQMIGKILVGGILVLLTKNKAAFAESGAGEIDSRHPTSDLNP